MERNLALVPKRHDPVGVHSSGRLRIRVPRIGIERQITDPVEIPDRTPYRSFSVETDLKHGRTQRLLPCGRIETHGQLSDGLFALYRKSFTVAGSQRSVQRDFPQFQFVQSPIPVAQLPPDFR